VLLAVAVLLGHLLVCVVSAKLLTPLQISQADDGHSEYSENAEEDRRGSSSRNQHDQEGHHSQGQNQPTEEEAPGPRMQVIFQHPFTLAI